MVGDVNIFLTDPTDLSLAELEVMIAGDALSLFLMNILHIHLFRVSEGQIVMFSLLHFDEMYFFVRVNRAKLQG